MKKPVCDNPRFQDLFRFVRVWAKLRGIYGSSHGFLNGIACQLLSAHVVRLYPQDEGYALVRRFFEVCTQINWKKGIVWFDDLDPALQSRWEHDEMILITPVRHPVNKLKRATRETLGVMMREFDIERQKTQRGQEWEKLVQPPIPLEMSTRFVFVQFWVRDSEPDEEFDKWKGHIVAQLPLMVRALREARSDCQPTPLGYTFAMPGEDHRRNCGCFFIGFQKPAIGGPLHLRTVNNQQVFGLKGVRRKSTAFEITPRFFKKLMVKYKDQFPKEV
jgi:poly(A) polymerase Pap1